MEDILFIVVDFYLHLCVVYIYKSREFLTGWIISFCNDKMLSYKHAMIQIIYPDFVGISRFVCGRLSIYCGGFFYLHLCVIVKNISNRLDNIFLTSVYIQIPNMSRLKRKPAFCICENKDADQLCWNPAAYQYLCFCYIDSTIPLLLSEISNLYLSSVAVQSGLCQTPKTGFLAMWLRYISNSSFVCR